MTKHKLLASFALTAAAAGATAQDGPAPEFGTIAWQRDYAAAIDAAQEADKPVLLLFQEVPG